MVLTKRIAASTVSTAARVRDDLSRLNQADLMQTIRFDQPSHNTHAPDGGLMPPATFLSSQHGDGNSTQSRQQHLPLPAPNRNYHAFNYTPAVHQGFAKAPQPPLFGGLPPTACQPMEYGQLSLQLQALYQHNQDHDVGTARQPPVPPPFGASGPLNCDGQGFFEAQGHFSRVGSLQCNCISRFS